ncbi:MAG: transporter substrate-binding domain-containing protein, partial [Propionibacteriaceae bacterium]|nr:transporter substrate-binding domain-containing protein [Propionibacteriaceae bacterium]
MATTGCSSAPTTSPGVTGTGNVSLVTAGTLSVCTNLPFKPMEYKDENNAVIGFDMDMMGLVAAQLGVSVTPYEVDFDQITSGAAMLAGKCDIAASSITITDARAQAVNFSAPYFSATQALAVAADSGIKGLADMSGKKVAVETDTTGADYANEHATEYGYQVVIFDDGGTALNSILSGRADACLIDRAIVYGFVDDNPSTTVATEFQTGELY